MEKQTWWWWTGLRIISVANLGIWLTLYLMGAAYSPTQLFLSGVYVAVCAFRSLFPRIGLERMVLIDHWFSNIFLGRSLATIAELAFTAQIALILNLLSGSIPILEPVSFALLPLIAIAQVTCWAGLLTGDHRWHALEESLWVLMLLLITWAGWLLWPLATENRRLWIILSWVACGGAAFVMAALDIPMYLKREREQRGQRPTVQLSAALRDTLQTRRQEGRWVKWRPEAQWMTPYFSVAVWMSLAMATWGDQL
ncbi:MAG: hypothetical protein VYD19_00065 [Myxococcota bacterium]|nr:hypothetical protein [Myxococcota bacterium]